MLELVQWAYLFVVAWLAGAIIALFLFARRLDRAIEELKAIALRELPELSRELRTSMLLHAEAMRQNQELLMRLSRGPADRNNPLQSKIRSLHPDPSDGPEVS